jgi:hypothetical protein
MTEIRFPRRREDGSFVLDARFSISNGAILPLVRDYLQTWMKVNSTWVRIWRSNLIREERLDFYSDFLSEPRIEADPEGRSFSVVLEGRPLAEWWKDWAVRFVGDISRMFPEAKFEGFESRLEGDAS